VPETAAPDGDAERDAARLSAQLLPGAAPDRGAGLVDVVRHLLATQAQDPRGFRLALRARTRPAATADVDRAPTAADVDRALTVDRSMVVSWLNRGTLHLVAAEDWPWLHALTTPPLRTAAASRLARDGVPPADADRGIAAVEAALVRDGPLLREQLREVVVAAGVRAEGQALVHLLFAATMRGLLVRGPVVAGEQAFVLARDWLPAPPPVDRDAALAELAVRYLRGHGPATDRDLARWAGLPLGDARRGLAAVGGRLREAGSGLVDLAGRPAPGGPVRPVLLGAFDPLLLGWTSREPVLGPHLHLVTVNGIFRPVMLVGGRAVGTWRLPGGQVVLEPFGAVPAADRAALEADAADVVRFLGSARD
jgi:hypothetical protein